MSEKLKSSHFLSFHDKLQIIKYEQRYVRGGFKMFSCCFNARDTKLAPQKLKNEKFWAGEIYQNSCKFGAHENRISGI